MPLAALLVISLTGAQDGTGNEGRPSYRPKKAPVVSSAAPVTHAEAKVVFGRIQNVADRVLGRLATSFATSFPNDAKPISSAEVLVEYRKLTARYEPRFKLAPPVPKGATIERRFQIYRMVSPTGPLSVGAKTLSITQFGDSVGYFLVRLADFSHTPRKRFSPAIMGDA